MHSYTACSLIRAGSVLIWQVVAAEGEHAAREAVDRAAARAREERERRLWGPPPPPQYAAMLRGRLVNQVLGGAYGKTLVADVRTRPALGLHPC